MTPEAAAQSSTTPASPPTAASPPATSPSSPPSPRRPPSPPGAARRSRRHGALPGFHFTLTYTLVYLGVLVVLPLCTLFARTAGVGASQIFHAISDPRALAAYRLSFGASFAAGLVNVLFGLCVAWVLARYDFPGKSLVDALVDLPFALPTAVAGIALTALYAPNGMLGRLLEPHGIKVAFAPTGVVVAMIFVGLPFVVRTVQPVLADLDPLVEEAAAVLGASRAQTFFRVLLPPILPALVTGFALAFARALGEYGSVVFISGNMPLRTEIVPLLIVTKLEQYDYAGATAIAAAMLVCSFSILFLINLFQARSRKPA